MVSFRRFLPRFAGSIQQRGNPAGGIYSSFNEII